MATTKRMFLMAVVTAFLQIATAEDQATCVPKNCSIPKIYDPVCGSNSQTYVNEYQLECYQRECYSNLRLVKHAPCNETCHISSPCIQNPIISPVCGSDGRVYENMHVFRCYKRDCSPMMQITERGLNLLVTRTCTCKYKYCTMPKIRDPVCGSNGITYVNKYQLLCHQRDCYQDLHIVRRGYCSYPVTPNPFYPFGPFYDTK